MQLFLTQPQTLCYCGFFCFCFFEKYNTDSSDNLVERDNNYYLSSNNNGPVIHMLSFGTAAYAFPLCLSSGDD